MYTKQIVYRNQIVIYYSNKGKVLRYPTGVKIELYELEKVKRELDKGSFPKKYEDFYDTVYETQDKIEEIIRNYRKEKYSKPFPNEIKDILEFSVKGDSLLNYIELFIEEKKKRFNLEYFSSISIKDYISFRNSLIDYETEKDIELKTQDLENIIDLYIHFLSIKRKPKYYRQFKTKGGLSGRTMKKRLDIYKEFVTWLDKSKKVLNNSESIKYKIKESFNKIAKQITPKVKNYALDKDDFEELRKLRLDKISSNDSFTLDLFLFACSTGLRFNDLISINKYEIKSKESNPRIVKRAQKTHVEFEVPLNQECLKIIEKYQGNFNKFTNQYLNRNLKRLLSNSERFQEIITEFDKPMKKFELISFHTGRRTFISRLLNEFNVPPSKIMKMTGHTQIATLTKYIHTDKELFDTNKF